MAETGKKKPIFVKVCDIRPNSAGDNLLVKVVNFKTVVEKKRSDGSRVAIAEALVGDETGVIVLTCKNDQIEQLREGAYLDIRNSRVNMFQGYMRLTVDRWGKISPAQGCNFEPQTENNLSLIEYELVPVSQ